MNLMQELESRYSPLLQEKDQLEAQLTTLENDISFKREIAQLQAKVKISETEVTRLIAEGQFEQAAESQSEQREFGSRIKNLISNRNQEIDGLKQKIDFLSRERGNIAVQVLKEGFTSLQEEGWGKLEEAIDFIDGSYKEVENFVKQTGAQSAGVGAHSLKVYPSGQKRDLWLKVTKWVHVPV